MAFIKVGNRSVDVANANCSPELDCFQLGFDWCLFLVQKYEYSIRRG